MRGPEKGSAPDNEKQRAEERQERVRTEENHPLFLRPGSPDFPALVVVTHTGWCLEIYSPGRPFARGLPSPQPVVTFFHLRGSCRASLRTRVPSSFVFCVFTSERRSVIDGKVTQQ